ncbi:MAG: hypothetical protein LZF60_10046 [Nitrospira sp.]|nr:MAG: hypothetical protein LZF60_10046 [Nitrospira sp.]
MGLSSGGGTGDDEISDARALGAGIVLLAMLLLLVTLLVNLAAAA